MLVIRCDSFTKIFINFSLKFLVLPGGCLLGMSSKELILAARAF